MQSELTTFETTFLALGVSIVVTSSLVLFFLMLKWIVKRLMRWI